MEVVGLSRRSPEFQSPAHYIAIDLLNQSDVDACISNLGDLTHLFYAALQPGSNFAEIPPTWPCCSTSSELPVIREPRDLLPISRPHRTDNSAPANTTDATSAIRFRTGLVFPAFAAILIPASVLSKKSARLSRSV